MFIYCYLSVALRLESAAANAQSTAALLLAAAQGFPLTAMPSVAPTNSNLLSALSNLGVNVGSIPGLSSLAGLNSAAGVQLASGAGGLANLNQLAGFSGIGSMPSLQQQLQQLQAAAALQQSSSPAAALASVAQGHHAAQLAAQLGVPVSAYGASLPVSNTQAVLNVILCS